jgi:asparagine synthase (glutamine-hydrolysing)
MAGIAGIAEKGAEKKISDMIDRMKHRGTSGRKIFETGDATFGIVWNKAEEESVSSNIEKNIAGYEIGPGHFAKVESKGGDLILTRDELGVAPLYYGRDSNGKLCFSSEIKALFQLTSRITEMLPGFSFDGTILTPYYKLKAGTPFQENPDETARELFARLDKAVEGRIRSDDIGSWLSGGLDSSTISALAARHTGRLKTFSAGFKDAPDLEYAREMARFIKSEHHEVIVTIDDLLEALPLVIYHLESFDALLVRSSITNFLVAKLASGYVSEVFSGEGGDELFAGYDYLKSLRMEELGDELVNITASLHNTALQRVDRCASAHGTVPHVVFTDPTVVEFAHRIPVEYKIRDNIEKWILRKALEGMLPDSVFRRTKAKFWEGAGVKELISEYAEKQITDAEFQYERLLSNGLILNTKEELYYYRIFRDHFGSDIDLSWMGRTKGSPVE